jgi:hypothetical protein
VTRPADSSLVGQHLNGSIIAAAVRWGPVSGVRRAPKTASRSRVVAVETRSRWSSRHHVKSAGINRLGTNCWSSKWDPKASRWRPRPRSLWTAPAGPQPSDGNLRPRTLLLVQAAARTSRSQRASRR